jgi:hypothetical protein
MMAIQLFVSYFPTLHEINTELRKSQQSALQTSVNSQHSFDKFEDSDLSTEPNVVPRHIVLPNPTLFTRTSSSGASDRMDIDSQAITKCNVSRKSFSPPWSLVG